MSRVAENFVGSIKSFNPEKGWGHIECAETHQLYGKDMFMLRSQLNGSTVTKGDQVCFTVKAGQQGPEATNIKVMSTSQGVMGTYVAPTYGYGASLPIGYSQAYAAHAYGGGRLWGSDAWGSQGAGESFIGVVKSYHPDKGWGHISCEQTKLIYGKDIFVLRSQIPGGILREGEQVRFTVRMASKGPEAADVQVLSSLGSAPFAQQWGMVPDAQQWGSTAGAPQWGSVAVPQQWPQASGYGGSSPAIGGLGGRQTFFGVVKSFNEDKGWGHITCETTQSMYGKDMFVMRSALRGCRISAGDQVQFNVSMGLKGAEAANVCPVSQVAGFGGQNASGQLFAGSIKLFSEEKGWGFIVCDETHRLYGKDIFVHKREFGGSSLSLGDAVQFSVEMGKDGRPEAKNVLLNSGYGSAQAVRPSARATPY